MSQEEHHQLLQRQLRKHLKGRAPGPELQALLGAVSETYRHFEADRDLIERSMELSSDELNRKNHALARKNEALDTFAYRISHDLKGPARNLSSLVQLLKLNIDSDREFTETVIESLEKSVGKFLDRVKTVLEMTRVEKSLDEPPVNNNLKELIDQILFTIQGQIDAAGARVETNFDACPQVFFPKESLHSIIYNLISNAIKYRDPDKQSVVRIISDCNPDFTVLTISDNGIGIDLDRFRENLFGMFKRFHNHVEGTGVGLFLVKKIVESRGGKIDVESQPGNGTTFRVYIRKAAG